MKSYASLEKIFKEVTKLNNVIKLIQWSYNTSFANNNIKNMIDDLFSIVQIKQQMLSDPLIEDILNATESENENLSDTQKNIFLMMKQYHKQYQSFDGSLVKNIISSTIKCTNAWNIAVKENNINLILDDFAILVSLIREDLAMHAGDNTNYDVILKETGLFTDDVDDMCKQIGVYLKGTEFKHCIPKKIDFSQLEEIIDILFFKIGSGFIDVSVGLYSETIYALGGIKLAISKNDENLLLSFLHQLGKAMYLLFMNKSDVYPINPAVLEGEGYIFSRLMFKNPVMAEKVKRILKKQDLQTILLDYVNSININFDFMYMVTQYSAEKSLLNGEVTVKDLHEFWNEEIKYYLGFPPEKGVEFLLQNSSWYANKFGTSANRIIGIIYACNVFGILSSQESKIFKNNNHPLKEIERFFHKTIGKEFESLIKAKKLDTKYYFDCV